MTVSSFRAFLARPAERRRPFFLDLGRLGIFLFAVLVATGALLAAYFRPSPEGAFDSVVTINDTVTLGWFVRSLHVVAGHGLVALTFVYLIRGFFQRLFLSPRGARAWPIAVGMAFVSLALLVSGESLPGSQTAHWATVMNAHLVARTPFIGHWLTEVFWGGPEVTGQSVVRVYAIHALLLPWVAFLLLARSREVGRSGGSGEARP